MLNCLIFFPLNFMVTNNLSDWNQIFKCYVIWRQYIGYFHLCISLYKSVLNGNVSFMKVGLEVVLSSSSQFCFLYFKAEFTLCSVLEKEAAKILQHKYWTLHMEGLLLCSGKSGGLNKERECTYSFHTWPWINFWHTLGSFRHKTP